MAFWLVAVLCCVASQQHNVALTSASACMLTLPWHVRHGVCPPHACSLSPAYLDAPYAPGHDFTGVNSLCLSLIRTKYDSLVVQPLRSVPPGAGMGWHGGPGTAVTDLGNRFTTLKSLDLSGQLLVSSLLDSLTRLPALNSLQLEGCTLGLQELASSVSRITNLQALNLAGGFMLVGSWWHWHGLCFSWIS